MRFWNNICQTIGVIDVKKIYVHFSDFHGPFGGIAGGNPGFPAAGASDCAVLYCLHYWKYAPGANYIPVCEKDARMGADKPLIGRFFSFCLEKGEKGGKKLEAKAGRGLFLALLLFVGIPLPGTGAWTGTLAASILDMDFKSSVTAVMLGVLLAGIIMGIASVTAVGMLF